MTIPENIGVNHIQASIFSFLYKTFPHLHQLIHPISVFTQITRNATQITKEPERNATHVLQGCFWDSELSRTWVVFSGHWWEWPCCRRWQWCTGSARNPKTRPPPSTNLRAWKPSEFPFERILCGGKFEMTALMVERLSEREEALRFLIYSSETLQKLTATPGYFYYQVPTIYINKHSGPLYC